MLFVHTGRPGSSVMGVLVRQDGREALVLAATATFLEGTHSHGWSAIEMAAPYAHLAVSAQGLLGEAKDE